jgi:putative PEP-CTERM system integral membrane protein
MRVAVVLDRSFSMSAHADQVTAAFVQLEQALGPQTPFDIYLTSSNYRGDAPSLVSSEGFDPSQVVYFGGQNAADLLVQFEQLRLGKDYDAILVFTDGSGYELGASPEEVPIPAAPAWMVHLGSNIPLGYDDQSLEAIQASGGGVSGDLDEALQRLAQALHGSGSTDELRDVLDGYVWSVLPTAQAESASPTAIVHGGEDGFIALAARRFILAEMQRQRGAITQLETLDQLHALAQQYSIVTPYSSMIVLVNELQQNLLENLESGNDRYTREFEELKNTTPATSTPLTGVPEPGEWLLLGLAVAMLAWYSIQGRRGVRVQSR